LEAPQDLGARAAMLYGASWAGLAIEHSMLGAAHSLANPLGARTGLAHGVAVGLALPAVVRFNAADPRAAARYAARARDAGLCAGGCDDGRALEALLEFLRAALRTAGVDPALGRHGVRARDVPALAAEAEGQWTARFNPRPVTGADFAELLRSAL
jgi:alcohol dehydrogenase